MIDDPQFRGPPRRVFGRLSRLMLKELREILRDRRTIVTLVLMPILVYPLLSITFNRFLVSNFKQFTETEYAIAVWPESMSPVLQDYLAIGERLISDRASEPAESKPTIRWYAVEQLDEEVANFNVHLGVRVKPGRRVRGMRRVETPIVCELFFRDRSVVSKEALHYVESRLRAVDEEFWRQQLRSRGLNPNVPAQMQRRPVVPTGGASFSLATLVPLILILMTITGAVYPAIDLTAGERERGTLEALVAAPVPRMGLLLAKYVAVLTVAMLTAIVNLIAMTVTLLASGLAAQLFGDGSLSLLVAIEVFALTALFAGFFSALLLALTSFARSFKEAQAYLIPLMMLSIAPGLLSLMPGLELNGLLAVTPLVNIVLLARDTIQGTASFFPATIVILSTSVYAVGALMLAARIFGADSILYAGHGGWSELFYRPTQERQTATTTSALACLAVMFPLYYVLGNAVILTSNQGVAWMLAGNAVVTLVVFAVVPIIFAAAKNVRLVTAFRFAIPSPWAWPAALLLGLALWPFAHEIFLLNQKLGLVTLSEGLFSRVEETLQAFGQLPLALILLCLAVVPAVSEEIFFRGFLFGSLRGRTSAWLAIVISAGLFGAFHVLTPTVLSPERFLGTAFMGLVLGWVRYRSDSLWPGVLLHVCHNGLLLTMARYREPLSAWTGLDANQTHFPLMWLAGAGVTCFVGLGLLNLAGPARPPDSAALQGHPPRQTPPTSGRG